MHNITAPRVIRDRLPPGKALAVQLLVHGTLWMFLLWAITR